MSNIQYKNVLKSKTIVGSVLMLIAYILGFGFFSMILFGFGFFLALYGRFVADAKLYLFNKPE